MTLTAIQHGMLFSLQRSWISLAWSDRFFSLHCRVWLTTNNDSTILVQYNYTLSKYNGYLCYNYVMIIICSYMSSRDCYNIIWMEKDNWRTFVEGLAMRRESRLHEHGYVRISSHICLIPDGDNWAWYGGRNC